MKKDEERTTTASGEWLGRSRARTVLAGGLGSPGFWIAACAICLVYVALRLPILDVPLERDEGLFGYAGQVILDGGLPYRDVLDHKPPVVFYLYALALLLVPHTARGVHVFLHVYNFVTLVGLYLLARRIFSSRSAGLWAALAYAVLSSGPAVQGFSASTEMLALLPLTVSLLAAVRSVDRGGRGLVLLSGIGAALAFWIKPPSLLIAAVALGYPVLRGIGGGEEPGARHRRAGLAALAWMTGFAGVALLIGAYFYSRGVFGDFVYWSFTHNLHYSAMYGGLARLSRYARRIGGLIAGNPLPALLAVATGCLELARNRTRGLFLLGLIGLSVCATLPGNAYRHYFALLAPALALGAGLGCSRLVEAAAGARRRALIASLLAGATLAVPLTVSSTYYFAVSPGRISRDLFGLTPFPESIRLADYIERNTRPEDLVFVRGSEPQILFYARRRSATSFVMVYPLTRTAYPRYREFQERAWAEIRAAEPEYILSVELPSSHLWDERADLWLYRNVKRLLARRYRLEAVMTVEEPEGRLLTGKETDPYRGRSERNTIAIFRRR